MTYGNYERSLKGFKIGCWHFGTKRIKGWWSPHTASSRKLGRCQPRRLPRLKLNGRSITKQNKDMKKIKLYTTEELLDEDLGPIGTPERDDFEKKLADELHAYRAGEAIRQAREAQELTQAELGERMGVQRSQVCRLESGKSITLKSMMRAFRALGVDVALEMKGIGKVTL